MHFSWPGLVVSNDVVIWERLRRILNEAVLAYPGTPEGTEENHEKLES
jgi:hypothetical protein